MYIKALVNSLINHYFIYRIRSDFRKYQLLNETNLGPTLSPAYAVKYSNCATDITMGQSRDR